MNNIKQKTLTSIITEEILSLNEQKMNSILCIIATS